MHHRRVMTPGIPMTAPTPHEVHMAAVAPIQKAINALHYAEKWFENAKLEAQALSLHGEKRLCRFFSVKCHWLYNHLQTEIYDLAHVKVYPDHVDVNVMISSVPHFFADEKAMFDGLYEAMHQVSNELVVAKYDPLACHLKCLYKELYEECVEMDRMIHECELHDYSWHVLHDIQICRKNRHDHMESKEVELQDALG